MDKFPTKEQEDLIKKAGAIIKEAFPQNNMQFSFNLTQKHSNVSYNFKMSGILNEGRT
jgi:hypothetical protein